MDHYDQELLDKQMRAIYQPPRQAGGMMLAIVAIFLCGMIAGTMLSRTSAPVIAFLDHNTAVTPR